MTRAEVRSSSAPNTSRNDFRNASSNDNPSPICLAPGPCDDFILDIVRTGLRRRFTYLEGAQRSYCFDRICVSAGDDLQPKQIVQILNAISFGVSRHDVGGKLEHGI